MKHQDKLIFSTKWIAYTAMMTALVVITSYIPPVPMFPSGNIYWCDSAIFIAAYLLDPLAAFIVGGLGTFLYDLIHGNTAMMVISLVIHGLQAVGVSVLLHYILPKKKEAIWAVAASALGAVIVIIGYFISRVLVQGNGIEYALLRMPACFVQELIGVAVAFFICYVARLKEQLIKNHLLPDWNTVIKKRPSEEQPKDDR